jgi:hypothetical protein
VTCTTKHIKVELLAFIAPILLCESMSRLCPLSKDGGSGAGYYNLLATFHNAQRTEHKENELRKLMFFHDIADNVGDNRDTAVTN